MEEIIAQYVTECVLGMIALATALFKYRETIQFLLPVLKWLVKPVKGLWNWIKMPYSVSAQQIIDGDKIKTIESKLDDLIKFTKEKLSPNGGSSPVDAIKRIESYIKGCEQFQYATMQDAPFGYFKCATTGHNEWVNRTYARFLGCGAQELLGLGWKKFIKQKELDRYNDVWKQAFVDGCEFDDVVEFCDAEGQIIHLRISVSAMTGIHGSVTGYIGQVTPL